jgi:hypothetical protein
MTLQRSCHARVSVPLVCIFFVSAASPVLSDPATHEYPTHARVEYVNDCVAKGGKLANLYQCSCAIDRIAQRLSYDDFVEASTFARYASLPGEGGAIFRDSERARSQAKLYRELEAGAWQACGLGAPPP